MTPKIRIPPNQAKLQSPTAVCINYYIRCVMRIIYKYICGAFDARGWTFDARNAAFAIASYRVTMLAAFASSVHVERVWCISANIQICITK